jgi:penicillin-binding protein 1A
VFPNKGYLVPNTYVTKIVDRNGKILEKHDPPVLLDDTIPQDGSQVRQVSDASSCAMPPGKEESSERSASFARRRIDEGTAYIMTTLLQGVVQSGTATILKKIVGRSDLAGKTGTTNDNIDAWFMGFTPDYTCGVWVGFDDEVSMGNAETGGKAAAPIWGYFMRQALKGKPIKEFEEPSCVERRRVDPSTGLATNASNGVEEVFKVGSGPTRERPTLIKGARWDHSGSDLDQF